MNKLNKQTENEMINYIADLLKTGIYCFGYNTDIIARHLVGSGCRIQIGPRRRKYLEKYKHVKGEHNE